ncbi:MAG: undecaprenyl-diphosphate phosphatase [Spirochaetota bacterium]
MTIGQAILFGVIQGATEFLPVSSSGHLALLKNVLELSEVPILFDVLLHVATLIVVVVVFRNRILRVLAAIGRWVARRATPEDAPNLRLAWVIVVTTVVTGVIGVALNDLEIGLRPRIVSVLFLVTAAILIGARFLGGAREYREIGLKDALIVGAAQGLGVLPGISRSGITISASLAAGLSRERAGEFAFLVSVPAILGALVLSLGERGELAAAVGPAALVAGFVSALVVGLAALLLLIRLIRGGRLYLFSIYLVPLGIAGLILL